MDKLRPVRLSQMLALGWLSVVVLVALSAPYLPLAFAPAAPDLAHVSTSPADGAAFGHWLGTDPLGRDVLANLVFGCRTLLLLTLPAAVLANLLGGSLGGLAGFGGRSGWQLPLPGWLLTGGALWWGLRLPLPTLGLWAGVAATAWALAGRLRGWRLPSWPVPFDSVVLAGGAMLGTVPRLLLVVTVAANGQLSMAKLLGLLVLTSWPAPARLVRAETLRVQTLPFVEAARVLGLPAGRVWWHHVMPLAMRPLQTALPLSLASLISLESTLSFLGVGLAPTEASWGRLISAARLDIGAWWVAVLPMILLGLTVLAARALAARPFGASPG